MTNHYIAIRRRKAECRMITIDVMHVRTSIPWPQTAHVLYYLFIYWKRNSAANGSGSSQDMPKHKSKYPITLASDCQHVQGFEILITPDPGSGIQSLSEFGPLSNLGPYQAGPSIRQTGALHYPYQMGSEVRIQIQIPGSPVRPGLRLGFWNPYWAPNCTHVISDCQRWTMRI